MNKTISTFKKKRAMTLLILLIFLIMLYIMVICMESKSAFSSEARFIKSLKDMEICLRRRSGRN
ncbi:MAG: hypothetical protein PHR25_03565 [Clostridia bacterium]|nr:hypothetical protein [Clostridia bacterium]MDD4375839.1 hypothetical protein [Clostridia bacterium]